MSKFDEVYKKIAVSKNYIKPNYPRMDNWAVDRYEAENGMFAAMADGGYTRWLGSSILVTVIFRLPTAFPSFR